jgi:hypothetical protein
MARAITSRLARSILLVILAMGVVACGGDGATPQWGTSLDGA